MYPINTICYVSQLLHLLPGLEIMMLYCIVHKNTTTYRGYMQVTIYTRHVNLHDWTWKGTLASLKVLMQGSSIMCHQFKGGQTRRSHIYNWQTLLEILDFALHQNWTRRGWVCSMYGKSWAQILHSTRGGLWPRLLPPYPLSASIIKL